MKICFFIITLLSLSFLGCSKKPKDAEPKYTAEEFMALAHEAGPSHEKGEGAINLSEYSPGVNRTESVALSYKRLTFFAVEFETAMQARNEAKRLNQYYVRNWLLDRVEGEPILEDYVVETFKATNPNRKIQRIPKKSESAHDETHSTNSGAVHH